jgi:hypothetical protein
MTTRRNFVAGTAAAATSLVFPLVARAQPAPVTPSHRLGLVLWYAVSTRCHDGH